MYVLSRSVTTRILKTRDEEIINIILNDQWGL